MNLRYGTLAALALSASLIAPQAAQAEIKAALASKPNATVYSYPSQSHAFSRHNGAHYNAAAAQLANRRTGEFLNLHLR